MWTVVSSWGMVNTGRCAPEKRPSEVSKAPRVNTINDQITTPMKQRDTHALTRSQHSYRNKQQQNVTMWNWLKHHSRSTEGTKNIKSVWTNEETLTVLKLKHETNINTIFPVSLCERRGELNICFQWTQIHIRGVQLWYYPDRTKMILHFLPVQVYSGNIWSMLYIIDIMDLL